MTSVEKKSSFTRASSSPLLTATSEGGSPSSHPVSPGYEGGASSSEINRISWGRAIGMCNLYIVWLVLDLIGL